MDFSQWRLGGLIGLVAALAAAFVLLAAPGEARADGPMGNDFGLGFTAGNPTSFSGKFYTGSERAFDFHLGLFRAYERNRYGDALFLGGDHLWEVWNFAENDVVNVPFYAGVGGALILDLEDDCHRFSDGRCVPFDAAVGPRMPFGAALQFQEAPFELFLEMSPTLLMVFEEHAAGTDLDLDISILNFAFGFRFYF